LHLYFFLGYTHAFAETERPKDKIFLDINYIIPFLYRYRHSILDPSKHRTQILGVEYEFFKSPLVQLVFKLARDTIKAEYVPKAEEPVVVTPKESKDKESKRTMSTKNVTQPLLQQQPILQQQPRAERRVNPEDDLMMDPHTIINNLYALWEESKLENHTTTDLNNFILKLLAPNRYDQTQIRKTLKENVDKSESEVQFWTLIEKQLDSLSHFIGKYGSVLEDPTTPLPDNLCPVAPKIRDTAGEDANLPSEIY